MENQQHNAVNWERWLAKAHWTYYEMAALSLNIDPDWVEIWDTNALDFFKGDVKDDGSPQLLLLVNLKLKKEHISLGKSAEQSMLERLSKLTGFQINSESYLECWDEFQLQLLSKKAIPDIHPTKEQAVETLQYQDWELPSQISRKVTLEPSKKPSTQLDFSDHKQMLQYIEQLPVRVRVEQAKLIAGVKSEKTLKTRWLNGKFPKPHKSSDKDKPGGIYEWLKVDLISWYKQFIDNPSEKYVKQPVRF